jgi:ubiquitin-like modifier-activating enzyme ATG7
LSYADLKKYKFHHLFAFPAFSSTPQWACTAPIKRLTAEETSSLVEVVNTWRYSTDSRQHGFFLVKRDAGERWKVAELGEFERGFFEPEVQESNRLVAFVDMSTYPDNPGWPLRNLLMLVRKRWGWRKVRVLCYRDTHKGRHEPRSLIMECELEGEEGIGGLNLGGKVYPS